MKRLYLVLRVYSGRLLYDSVMLHSAPKAIIITPLCGWHWLWLISGSLASLAALTMLLCDHYHIIQSPFSRFIVSGSQTGGDWGWFVCNSAFYRTCFAGHGAVAVKYHQDVQKSVINFILLDNSRRYSAPLLIVLSWTKTFMCGIR